jgi:hypothetical protein
VKESLTLLTLISGMCLCAGCGGSSQPATPIATQLSVSAPASEVAGTPITFTVNVLDGANRVVTTLGGSIQFSSTDSKAILPVNPTLTGGTGIFSVTLMSPGPQTITAIIGLNGNRGLTGTSNSISVSTSGPDHFSFGTPATTSRGAAFNMGVSALDATNNISANYSGTVHFSSTDPLAILPANMTLTNGTANLPVTLNTLGVQTISATDTVTASTTGTSNSIMVNTPTPPVISSTPEPAAGAVGLPYFDNFTVASGGQPPFTWTETGALPPGLTFDTSSGKLTGTPTAPGSFPITLQVQDSLLLESAPQNFTIVVTIHGFHLTGSMSSARSDHTATLLPDGTVLVTGGLDVSTLLASAELFNPATGTFASSKGSMGTARAGHTATLLNDGTVLVIGGINGSSALATAELFDPTSGMFTPTKGNMNTPRGNHTATLLKDGRVLVTGGSDGNGELATAELFDPTTGMFTLTTGSMETKRSNHTATLLSNGNVLVTGGNVPAVNPNARVSPTAELFDPTAGIFTPTGSMTSPRAYQTATLLNDGTVFVLGGEDLVANNPFDHNSTAIIYLATADLFGPTTGMFASANGNMNFARAYHTATLLGDGTVLVAGGYDGTRVLTAAEIYDPIGHSFTRTADMTVTRSHHTATLLKDGSVLVTGGVAGRRAYFSSAELYK